MEFGAIQATASGVFVILGVSVVWLACRLKQKNRQLERAKAELQARRRESLPACQPENPPAASAEQTPISIPKPLPVATSAKEETIDGFLWEHLGDAFLWKHLADVQPKPVVIIPPAGTLIPAGMCSQSDLEKLLATDPAFAGLVVLVGIDAASSRRQTISLESFIKDLLGPSDFAAPQADDAFLIICPGLRAAEAQRRLNEISEKLWSFQLRGHGAFSILFGWGGIGTENQPLTESIASATERMEQTKRSRVLFFSRKAG